MLIHDVRLISLASSDPPSTQHSSRRLLLQPPLPSRTPPGRVRRYATRPLLVVYALDLTQCSHSVPFSSDFNAPLDPYWPQHAHRDQQQWHLEGGGSSPPTIAIPPASLPPPPPSVISAESPDSFVEYQNLAPDAPLPPSRSGSIGPSRRRNSYPFFPASPSPEYQPYTKPNTRKGSNTPPRSLQPLNKEPPNFSSMTPHQKSQFESDQRKRKTMFEINDLLLRNGVEVHGAPKQLQAFLNLYK